MTDETKNWKKFKEEARENDLDHQESLIDDEEDEIHDILKEEDSQAEKGALDHPSYKSLEEKLTLAEQQAHENWEKSVRALAELDNVRRRAEREVANAYRYSLEKFITSLLPVADSLEQAIQLADKHEDKAMHEGLELTMKLFHDTLSKHEVVQLNPEGVLFNPQEHEAMSMQETKEVPNNTVIAVFQKGYKLSDRVIRPARVIVSKEPK